MSFKLIYTSDLHGNEQFYIRLLKKAKEENVGAVVIGGDLCPKGEGVIRDRIGSQKFFLEKFLIPLFKRFTKENKSTEIYLIMGNDDFRINCYALENADENGILKCIHKRCVKLGKDFSIAGYSFVNPTPFSLKDWEKPDFEGDRMPPQLFQQEVMSMEKEEGTIKDDLQELKKSGNPKNTVYVMHAPPFGTNLDVITTRTHVGSKSIRSFIEKEQPPLTLHGHIHESPRMSGSWKDKIGKTACINAGSSFPEDKLNCVVIDVYDLDSIGYFELTQ